MTRSLKPHMWFFAELRRWFVSTTLWAITFIAAAMTVLSTFGVVERGAKQIADGVTDPESLTELALTMPFGGVLFTTFLAIIIVGKDFDTKFSNRLLALSKTPTTIIAVKGLVSAVLSTIVGAATLVIGRITTRLFLEGKDIAYLPQMDTAEWARGYMLLFVSGALWGVALALLSRTPSSQWALHLSNGRAVRDHRRSISESGCPAAPRLQWFKIHPTRKVRHPAGLAYSPSG